MLSTLLVSVIKPVSLSQCMINITDQSYRVGIVQKSGTDIVLF